MSLDSNLDPQLALHRLRRLERFKEVNAPDEMIEAASRKVAESRNALGEERWRQVEQEYPAFRDSQDDFERRMDVFRERCTDCKFFVDGVRPDGKWCEHFEYGEVSAPEPCVLFKLDLPNLLH